MSIFNIGYCTLKRTQEAAKLNTAISLLKCDVQSMKNFARISSNPLNFFITFQYRVLYFEAYAGSGEVEYRNFLLKFDVQSMKNFTGMSSGKVYVIVSHFTRSIYSAQDKLVTIRVLLNKEKTV